jgi:hypothetical protein
MSQKTRAILKVLAIVLVLLTVLMQFDVVIIPALRPFTYWIVVAAFGLLLGSSK